MNLKGIKGIKAAWRWRWRRMAGAGWANKRSPGGSVDSSGLSG